MSFESVLTKPEIRKIFGKAEIQIIKKQTIGLPLTQSEKNRLSRDIKAKFRAVELLNNHRENFQLKKNESIISKAIKTIINLSNPESILLFGSYADNTYTNKSDIDLCLKFKKITLKKATKIRISLLGNLPDIFDIQIYNVLPSKVKKSIDENNKTVYRKN